MSNKHFNHIREKYYQLFKETWEYLHNLDGDTSRELEKLINDIINDKVEYRFWTDKDTALFIKGYPDLWHEITKKQSTGVGDSSSD